MEDLRHVFLNCNFENGLSQLALSDKFTVLFRSFLQQLMVNNLSSNCHARYSPVKTQFAVSLKSISFRKKF